MKDKWKKSSSSSSSSRSSREREKFEQCIEFYDTRRNHLPEMEDQWLYFFSGCFYAFTHSILPSQINPTQNLTQTSHRSNEFSFLSPFFLLQMNCAAVTDLIWLVTTLAMFSLSHFYWLILSFSISLSLSLSLSPFAFTACGRYGFLLPSTLKHRLRTKCS